ncbi:MAG TPA: SUMF1/EgtB/PvdO family nonheme iron enzyme [Saprospiraceae bacterium]|nr:SUMF1/EgtB/PvdO family nonheme iron enzyme [Saprospiraceae bacterium]
MKNTTAYTTLVLSFILISGVLYANSITVSNVSRGLQNTTEQYVMVQFDLSWENSWRTSSGPANWDAAWVFIKYRVAGGEWQHAWLNGSGHTAPSGSTIDVGLRTPGSGFHAMTNPGLGVFIYRSANGTGTFTAEDVHLRWNYGDNGVADSDNVEVKVFAIEMVYVPEGNFQVGSGGQNIGEFRPANVTAISGTVATFEITSTPPVIQGNNATSSTSNLSARSGNNLDLGTGIGTATLASGFPTGYGAFYGMKYEISQGQYRDFLNTLTRNQQETRFASITVGNYMHSLTGQTTPMYRNGVRLVSDPGGISPRVYACDLNPSVSPYTDSDVNQSDDGEWIACNWLSWGDGMAYADWSGLRPMTELEYEKACRGDQPPVEDEYAWGTTSTTAATSISDGGEAGEKADNMGSNVVFGNQTNVQGPLRVGSFAQMSTTRELSGSGYYGMMELSGNLWERAVTIGNADGRSYTGEHGDGVLSVAGHSNELTWPGLVSGVVTGSTGSGFRGGGYLSVALDLKVSFRNFAATSITNRFNDTGLRLVRSAG